MDCKSYQARRASLGLFGDANQADPEPTGAEIREWLAGKGYTRFLYADGDDFSGPIAVKPTADLDGTFTAYDLDEDEFVRLNGWVGTFEETPA